MKPFPVIRMEIEGMKASILHAMSQYQIDVDAYVKEALDRITSDDAIQQLVNDEAEKAIEEAVRKEVRDFFAYGNGRVAIRAAVLARLEEPKRTSGDVDVEPIAHEMENADKLIPDVLRAVERSPGNHMGCIATIVAQESVVRKHTASVAVRLAMARGLVDSQTSEHGVLLYPASRSF